jgi:hypothetical protein
MTSLRRLQLPDDATKALVMGVPNRVQMITSLESKTCQKALEELLRGHGVGSLRGRAEYGW